MDKVFSDGAWDEYLHWSTHDRKMISRIHALIQECERTPFSGTGKPEPLKGEWQGWWSRRIDEKHRLIYRVHEGRLHIAKCMYHYSGR